jgi:flagellin-like protein
MIREEKDMYTQDRGSKIEQRKSKKAISEMIGYVLLIAFTVVLAGIVYFWMKTYVPQEDVNCPDGTSLYIETYSYDCPSHLLILNIKNNGKFDIGGYFIYATDNASQQLATIDLSKMNRDSNSILIPLGIKFGDFTSKNSLIPNANETDAYNVTNVTRINNLSSVDIVPIRWQTQNRKMMLVSCKDAEIRENIQCN